MHDTYQSPLVTRTASTEMSHIWSDNNKFKLWRGLWYELAAAQAALGIPITPAQLAELAKAINIPINHAKAAEYEAKTNHDVMAHIKLLGDDAPSAAGIIHLGSTSQFVVDNADSIRIRSSIQLILSKLRSLVISVGTFAQEHRSVATLALTHFQPATPTTVGRRAASWSYGLYLVYTELLAKFQNLRALGAKGATGTQASFLELFSGDKEKVDELDRRVCRAIGFDEIYMLSGQTYPRVDDSVLTCLIANLAAECQKITTDIRLLSGKGEMAESFSKDQVGSSAMPYKKNPLTCERVCGLSKFIIGLATSSLLVTSEQWLERTLDDSSARRLILPEAFLAIDGILESMNKIFKGLVINKRVIQAHLMDEIGFLVTEKVLMIACKHGADRQKVHEAIKQCALSCQGDTFLRELQKLPELASIDIAKECAASSLIGLAEEQTIRYYSLVITQLEGIKI